MRVAVCFSGHGDRLNIHEFDKQLQMYKNYDHIDMFFSLWDTNREVIESTIKQLAQNTQSGSYKLYFEWKQQPSESPLKYTKCHEWCSHYIPLQWYSQYSGIKNADLFRQQHSNDYDLVIRSRLDVGLAGDCDFALWDQLLNSYDVIFPRSWNWKYLWNDEGGCLNDQFFIARPDTMSRITLLSDRIDEYVDLGCRMHGESLMWWNITKGCSAKYQFGEFDTILRGRIESD